MTSSTVVINGLQQAPGEAHVSVYNTSFLYGEGVFETLRTYGRTLFAMPEHVARLYDEAASLELPIAVSPAQLQDELVQAVAATEGTHELVVRIVISRTNPGPGLSWEQESTPLRVVLVDPLHPLPAASYTAGVGAMTLMGEPGFVAGTSQPQQGKRTSYLVNLWATREARRNHYNEALWVRGKGGEILEGATSNPVLILNATTLLTPPRARSSVDGITLRYVRRLAAQQGLHIRAEPITMAMLPSAQELFLCSTLREILPVVTVDQQRIGTGAPGPMTKRLQQAFRAVTQESEYG